MIILFLLFGCFFIALLFIDVTVDENNEHQEAIARNLTLIAGIAMMTAIFAVAILL